MKILLFIMSIITMLLTSCSSSSSNSDRQVPNQEEVGEILSLISTGVYGKQKGVSYLIYYDQRNSSFVNLDSDTTSTSATVIVYKNKYTITVINEDVPIVAVSSTFQNLGNYPSQEHYFKSLAAHISRGFYNAKEAKESSKQFVFHGYQIWTEYQDGRAVLRFQKK